MLGMGISLSCVWLLGILGLSGVCCLVAGGLVSATQFFEDSLFHLLASACCTYPFVQSRGSHKPWPNRIRRSFGSLQPFGAEWKSTVHRFTFCPWGDMGFRDSPSRLVHSTFLVRSAVCQKPVLLLQWWKDGAMFQLLQLLDLAFHQRARWFANVLKQCLRHAGVQREVVYGKPLSHMLQMHTRCVAVPWTSKSLTLVDNWLFSLYGACFIRHTDAFDALPLAYSYGFPYVFMTTVGT